MLGFKPWVKGELPRYKRKPKKPKPEVKSLHLEKFRDIVGKDYVRVPKDEEKDGILRLFDCFDVEKPGDIRIVYNGTSCGLNEDMLVPSFWLPTAKTAGRFLTYNYCFMDKDIGEMFLNFPLSNQIAPLSGFDLTHYRNEMGFTDITKRKRKFAEDKR